MAQAVEIPVGTSVPEDTARPATCARCGRSLVGRPAFMLGGQPRHFRCSLLFKPLLRRSTLTALVVGTALTGINQGTVLAAGVFPSELFWKIPLTYCVP